MSLLQSRNVMVDDQCIIGVRGAAGGCKSRVRLHIRFLKPKYQKETRRKPDERDR
jgi:hypothetical protein